jgi:hypothetical protein
MDVARLTPADIAAFCAPSALIPFLGNLAWAALWAFRAWEAAAGGALRFEARPEQTAVVRVYRIADLGGHYGETVPILINGRRGAAVYARSPRSSGPTSRPWLSVTLCSGMPSSTLPACDRGHGC